MLGSETKSGPLPTCQTNYEGSSKGIGTREEKSDHVGHEGLDDIRKYTWRIRGT